MTYIVSSGTLNPTQLGQTDLVLTCHQGSLVGLCMQDYKVSVCSGYDFFYPA